MTTEKNYKFAMRHPDLPDTWEAFHRGVMLSYFFLFASKSVAERLGKKEAHINDKELQQKVEEVLNLSCDALHERRPSKDELDVLRYRVNKESDRLYHFIEKKQEE